MFCGFLKIVYICKYLDKDWGLQRVWLEPTVKSNIRENKYRVCR